MASFFKFYFSHRAFETKFIWKGCEKRILFIIFCQRLGCEDEITLYASFHPFTSKSFPITILVAYSAALYMYVYVQAKIEAEEAAEAAREVGLGNSDDDLTKMIMQRQQVRENEANNFFKNLEAKYSKPKAKASGGKGKKKQSKTARK